MKYHGQFGDGNSHNEQLVINRMTQCSFFPHIKERRIARKRKHCCHARQLLENESNLATRGEQRTPHSRYFGTVVATGLSCMKVAETSPKEQFIFNVRKKRTALIFSCEKIDLESEPTEKAPFEI